MLRDFPQLHLLVGRPAHIYSRVMATTAPFAAPETAPSASLRPLAIARWLEAVAFLVVLIVLVGGITRLTESGLSITHWSVVTGILPPLTEAAWIAEYELYQQTGEYKFESGPAGMDLDKFKFIYFWEWFHRILGRVIGLAFLLPMVWFWVRSMIPQGYKPRLIAMFALICGQGALGWYMVNSGVGTDLTDVSHFRLSAHLLTALFLLGGLVWTARDLRNIEAGPSRLTLASATIAGVLFIQLLLGAWVAGLNAGHAAYDWPLMNGKLIPDVSFSNGFFATFTNDPFLLHWLHRWWAWVAVVALVVLARRVRATDRAASIAVHSAFGLMVILGITTVLTEVELWVAAAHQLTGALLVASVAWAMHSDGKLKVAA